MGKGHTLVIPRKEVDYIFDMEDADLAEFEVFAKKVANASKVLRSHLETCSWWKLGSVFLFSL